MRDPNNSNTAEPFDPDAAAAPAPDSQVVPPPPQPGPVDGEAARTLAQRAALPQEMRAAQEADRALQQRVVETLEGLRGDVNHAVKTLGALVAGGGLGHVADPFKG
jgi:hypothetical protein